MKIKQLKEKPWPALAADRILVSDKEDFCFSIKVHRIDGNNILELRIYVNRKKYKKLGKKSQDRARIFISKKEKKWFSQIGDSIDRKSTLHDVLKKIVEQASSYYMAPYPVYCYPWPETEGDEARLLRYLNKKETNNHGIDDFQKWQEEVLRQKRQERQQRADELSELKLEGCPENIPDYFHEYIRRVVIPEDNIMLYRKKSRGKQKGQCVRCGHEITLTGPFFSMYGIRECPICRTRCTTLSKNSSVRDRERLSNVAFIQRGADGSIWIRQFHLWRDDSREWKDLSRYLEEFGRIRLEDSAVYAFRNEGKYGMNNYICKYSGWYRVSGSGVYDGSYYLCMDGIDEAFAGTRFQYCDLRGYKKRHGKDSNPISYLQNFARYPSMEYLEKLGYKQIVENKVNGRLCKEDAKLFNFRGKNINAVFVGVDKRSLKAISPADVNLYTLEILRAADSYNVTNEDIVHLASLGAVPKDIKKALTYVKPANYTEYIKSIANKLDRTAQMIAGEYADYIGDCEELGYDLTNKQILFPADFSATHQKVAELRMAKANGALDEAIRERYSQNLKKLMYRDKTTGLFIRPVKSYGNLVMEGKTLSHCVGTYAQKVANGETTILVIRKISAPDEPYYTLELNDGRIVQCRGRFNCAMTADVKGFVEKWVRRKLKNAKVKISA